MRTRAERDGDDWIINGQKIWTSGAHLSDFGIIVVRTDPNVPKHEGLTFFFLEMKSPGIEVRPIHQMSGTRHFNEVFFTDVRVPDAQRLGQVGQGWRVSLTTLMNERLAVGDPARPDVDDLVALSRSLIHRRPAGDPEPGAVRERIAEWYARSQGLKFTKFRTMTALSKGETPGPENSIHKLVNASKLQDIASYGMDLMGEAGMVIDEDLVEAWGMFQSALLSSPSMRIAGGSDEILKNIIAERVIGLAGGHSGGQRTAVQQDTNWQTVAADALGVGISLPDIAKPRLAQSGEQGGVNSLVPHFAVVVRQAGIPTILQKNWASARASASVSTVPRARIASTRASPRRAAYVISMSFSSGNLYSIIARPVRF